MDGDQFAKPIHPRQREMAILDEQWAGCLGVADKNSREMSDFFPKCRVSKVEGESNFGDLATGWTLQPTKKLGQSLRFVFTHLGQRPQKNRASVSLSPGDFYNKAGLYGHKTCSESSSELGSSGSGTTPPNPDYNSAAASRSNTASTASWGLSRWYVTPGKRPANRHDAEPRAPVDTGPANIQLHESELKCGYNNFCQYLELDSAGPPFPSRADGTLLQGSQLNIYLMQGGSRHLIPDAATLTALGYTQADVENVACRLKRYSSWAPVPEGGKIVTPQFPITATQFDSLSRCGGHMNTTVTILSDGTLNAVTRTWEDTDLRGFEGAVAAVVLDQKPESTLGVPVRRSSVSTESGLVLRTGPTIGTTTCRQTCCPLSGTLRLSSSETKTTCSTTFLDGSPVWQLLPHTCPRSRQP